MSMLNYDAGPVLFSEGALRRSGDTPRESVERLTSIYAALIEDLVLDQIEVDTDLDIDKPWPGTVKAQESL